MNELINRIIFKPTPYTESILEGLSPSDRSTKINSALRLMLKKESNVSDQSIQPIAPITSALAGMLETDKKFAINRGEDYDQVSIQHLKKKIYEAVKSANKPSGFDDLLTIAAASYLVGFLFQTYVFSAGSQLRLLSALHGKSLPVSRVKACFYDPAAVENQNFYANWPFESWLKPMSDIGLLSLENDICKLQPIGRQLIDFCLAQGLFLNKPL